MPSACPCMGQARQMTQATEGDYSRWGTLELKSISEKGKWISFEMRYESAMDTLFLCNTSTNKTYPFPKGKDGKFAGEAIFAFLDAKSNLRLFNLTSLKTAVLKDVASYELPLKGKFIVTASTGSKDKLLTLYNGNGKTLDTISGITEYVMNSHSEDLLYITKKNNFYESGIIHFGNYHQILIIEKSPYKLFKPTWQDNMSNAAFLSVMDSASNKTGLYYYRARDSRVFSFNLNDKILGKNLIINSKLPLQISKDGKKVFFTLTRNKTSNSQKRNATVEMWNGNDKSLYPARCMTENGTGTPKKAVWFPETDSLFQLNGNGQFTVGITGRQDFAVIIDKNPYGLQDKYYEEADFYIKQLRSVSTIQFLKKQSIDPAQMKFDPSSNRILYYREKNWWIFNPIDRQHINLTDNKQISWDNDSEPSIRSQFSVYGCAGWSIDGKNILLYDQYDIWMAASDGSYIRRLTKGREKNISFRLNNPTLNKTFSMEEDLILESRNIKDHSTGYHSLNFKAGEKLIVSGSKKFEQLLQSKNHCFAYTSQTYNNPPQLDFKKNGTNPSVLFESNLHQKEYFYGKSEMVYYRDSAGEMVKCALIYPAGFNPSKKYPMIVYIYENMSNLVNNYQNPSLQSTIGFNITNYSINGYFVLLPDIIYKKGNPGISALESVKSAVNAVLEKGFVDRKKIGLYGHSFGGYEANFIISQTGLFSAAASGAGISDIVGYYFNISRNGIAQSEMWRFESQQYRMGNSLFEKKENYLKNNPLLNADKINTPLLLWSGKEDRVVPYTQSVAYYLALRKLKKPSVMLIYPTEDHNIKKASNQEDLSRRIIEWFDYFLKDKKTAEWISNATSND
ncbi:prolyl oligopeptidase family serine peptidase [Flavobacterium sp. B11]|uniref:alpha/beta hydrolase family protein n=1 Tax=Flavobacterium movens TaxID=214860 RepID=UPI0031DB72FE